MLRGRPKVYNLVVEAGSTYADNLCDFMADTGYAATFCQIETDNPVLVKLNDDENAVFGLADNTAQVFNKGDLVLSSLAIDNTASGASQAYVVVIIGY